MFNLDNPVVNDSTTSSNSLYIKGFLSKNLWICTYSLDVYVIFLDLKRAFYIVTRQNIL